MIKNIKNKVSLIIIIILFIVSISIVTTANSDIIVVLDPGHGGSDPGAISNNLLEKNIAWKIAEKVKGILDNTDGITGVLTRKENECPLIYNRAELAKQYAADLVVSFHINSSVSSIPRGSEVYVTRNTRINRFYKNSNILAIDILNNLYSIGIPKNGSNIAKIRATESGNIYPDNQQADYYGIIRYPMNYGIPSILIEHCFISNQYDRFFINDDVKIAEIAKQDANAIIKNKELFRIDKTKNEIKAKLDNIYYDSNSGCIKGKVLYNEIINDMSLDNIPKLYLTDGKNKTYANLKKESSYTYNYEINIMNLDPYKEYVLKIETTNYTSIPNNNVLYLSFGDTKLGTIYGMEIFANNSKITFNSPYYSALINTYPYTDISINGNNIENKLVIQEWIGDKQIEPKAKPLVRLVDDDGNYIECQVEYIEPYIYKYSISVENIDKMKQYKVQVKDGTNKNISTRNNMIVNYNNKVVGKVDNRTLEIKGNKLLFLYDGYMINSPYTKISLNGTTISGKLIVQEWLNGTKQIEPTTLPEIVIKDSNGTIIKTNALKYVEPYVYSYSVDVAEMDKTKVYTIEVKGTNSSNISDHQNVIVNFEDQEIGNINYNFVNIKNNKLQFTYDGYMTNSSYTKINLNGTTISGKLIVQEWLNGTKQIQPTTLPNIVIKDSNGTIIKTNELKYLEPYVYSYSVDVAEIDKTKLYTIEVQGTNTNNISTHQNVQVMFQGQEIGKVNNYTLKIESGKLLFEEIDNRYNGYMTNSPYTKISLNGTIISGKLIVQEWLNGTKQIQPTTLPDIVIKDLNGTIIKRNQLKYIEPYVYSYSIDIEELINQEDYILEVQGTNQNNTSTHQNVQIIFQNQQIGKIGEYEIRIDENSLKTK